jgi:hypothetical protein
MPFDARRRLTRAERDAARNRLARMRAKQIAALLAQWTREALEDGRIVHPLNREAPYRHILRRTLILQGWRWHPADAAAIDVVRIALELLRVERPSWAEGQRAYTQTDVTKDTACRQCGVMLLPRQVNFCSGTCRSRWWKEFNEDAS